MDSGPQTELARSEGSSYKRRPHRKSRTGCAECRRRRVKCTEEKPRCRCCVRHGAICRYPEPAALARAASSGPAASSPGDAPARRSASRPNDTVTTPIPSPSVSEVPCHISESRIFSMVDLALLHHWTVSTSGSLVRCREIDRIWQLVLPQIGFKHPFAMHAILSLAALHLAYTDRNNRQKHTIDAVRHHNSALQGFCDTIDRASDENADALVACSTLNVIYVFGVSPWSDIGSEGNPAAPGGSRKARVLGSEWIPMVRGVRAVVPAFWERVRSGPLRELLSLDDWEGVNPDRDIAAEDERFRALRSAWAQSGDHDARLYDETLYSFRRCYLYVVRCAASNLDASGGGMDCGFNKAWAGPIIFLFIAPEEYLTRLQQRQPAALIIFAHFGAVLHSLKRFWFLDGWARDIVEVVDDILGDYWKPWTAWPREVVGLV